MGIRGTEILSDVYKLDGVLKTDIALLRGKLDVAINEKTFALKPGEMIESHKFGPKSERAPLPPPMVREIPRPIFAKLQLNEKKGGEVFLFDAKNGTKKEMEPGMEKAPEFKTEIREKIKLDDINTFVPPQNDRSQEHKRDERKQMRESDPANKENRPITQKPIDRPTKIPGDFRPEPKLPPVAAPPIGGDRPPIPNPIPTEPIKPPPTTVIPPAGSGTVGEPLPRQ
jgi:hypothetical protein